MKSGCRLESRKLFESSTNENLTQPPKNCFWKEIDCRPVLVMRSNPNLPCTEHKLEFNDFLYDPERADGLAPSDDQIWYKKRSFGSSWVP